MATAAPFADATNVMSPGATLVKPPPAVGSDVAVACVVGVPLMRRSGLPAGIATFAVRGITYNILSYWQKIGPGVTSLSLVPESGIWTLTGGTLIVIAVVAVIVLARSVRIVPQARAAVVERLGRYVRTLGPGVAILVPFVDRMRPLIDLREQVVNFSPQPVITEDNVVVAI